MDMPKEHKNYLKMDFTLPREIESRLEKEDIYNIEIYGCWLRALERGEIEPITKEQEEFLEVVKGNVEPRTRIC